MDKKIDQHIKILKALKIEKKRWIQASKFNSE